MKKVFVITPALSGGGAEKIALNMVTKLASSGFDVTLVVFKLRGQYQGLLTDNIKVIDLGVRRTRYAFPKTLALLWREKPTHVLSVIRDANISVGLALLLNNKVRAVFREANTMNEVMSMPAFKRFIFKILMRISYSRANKVIANSNATRLDLLSNGVVDSAKVTVIGNPVLPNNVAELSEAYLPAEEWFRDVGVKVILNVGRLHRQKNHLMLLDAFSLAYQADRSLRLLILGEGVEKWRIERRVKELSIDGAVKLVGFRLNPYPYYKYSSLFVLSSDWEGFGNVIVEALSCGTPVISTNCPGGPGEILDNGRYGTLVPVGDPLSLAKAILETLRESSIDATRRSLKERADDFSIDNIGQRYLAEMRLDDT